MKAVGEIMAIGRTFEEAFGKAMRSLENGRYGLGGDGKDSFDEDHFAELVGDTEDRVFYVAEAFRRGWTVDQVFEANKIDRWFLNRIRDIVMVERAVAECALDELSAEDMLTAKQFGLSDDQIAYLTGSDELTVRARRKELGVVPVFKTVDTCAAEFESLTEYHYKTYELGNSEIRLSDKKRAMILGAGPNRIGQGIEFDYCCVHASYALHDAGYETIMVNCNPETVSTDYDTSDRLYFEPLTYEDVMDIVDVEQPDGVVVTLGGQTPLKLARALQDSGVHIMGTKPEAIDLAEDRDRFSEILDELSITYPAAGMASSFEEACRLPIASASLCLFVLATFLAVVAWLLHMMLSTLRSTWRKLLALLLIIRSISTASLKVPLKVTLMLCAMARMFTLAVFSGTSKKLVFIPATLLAASLLSRFPRLRYLSSATLRVGWLNAWA